MSQLTDFEQLVFEMRCRQKQYFTARIPARLIASKVIEKQVDEALDTLLGQAQTKFEFQIPADEIPY